jgi:hypothetical protein
MKIKVEHVFINLFIELKLKYRVLPLLYIYEIIELLKSPFIIYPFRRGSKVYILPVYIKPKKQYITALHWTVKNILIQSYFFLKK